MIWAHLRRHIFYKSHPSRGGAAVVCQQEWNFLKGGECLKDKKGVREMKKIAVVIIMVVAAIFIASSVFAFGGCGYSGKGDKNCSKGKEMKGDMKKDLGLTAEQDKQLEAGREAHRAEAKAMHNALKAKKDELKAAIAKPGATRSQVEPIVNELKALEVQITDKRVDGIFAVKAILTPEQFAKLEAMKEKHMKEGKEKHKNKGTEDGR